MSLKLKIIEQKISRIISLLDNIFLNHRREAMFYYGCFIVIGILLISYIVHSMNYFLPLGNDGIIYTWPAGSIIVDTPLKDIPAALISSFLGEDHIAPLIYVFGWVCALISNNPGLIVNIANKIIFVFLVIISLLVAYRILKDKYKVLLFFLFFGLDVSMYWRDLIDPIIIPVITPLLSLFFLNEYIEKKGIYNLLGFGVSYFLLSFSHETAFLGIPLLGIYCLFTVVKINESRKEKIKIIFLIYSLMFLFFIPYALIHYNLYGTFIPTSRAALLVQDGNYLSLYRDLVIWQFTEWLYGLDFIRIVLTSRYLILFILFLVAIILGINVFFKFRIFSKLNKGLFFGFLLQIACIIFTARFAQGMWLLAGIVLWLLIADFLINLIKKVSAHYGYFNVLFYGFIAAWIIIFSWRNETSGVIHNAGSIFHKDYLSSNAAYRAIGENVDRIVAIRLPGAETLMHPIAFWIGNKIYNGDPGLALYPDSLIYIMKNMYIESYNNVKNFPFKYYSSFLIPEQGNNEVILLKSKNIFTRVYLNADRRNILRATVIPNTSDGELLLHLPSLSGYNYNSSFLEVGMTFTGNLSNLIKRIHYGGKEVKEWYQSNGQIIFKTNDMSTDRQLRVEYNQYEAELELIEVRFPEVALYKKNFTRKVKKNTITLMTGEKSCRYFISLSSDSAIAGTLEADKRSTFAPLIKEPVSLVYLNFQLRPDLRDKKIIDLADRKYYGSVIKLCQ